MHGATIKTLLFFFSFLFSFISLSPHNLYVPLKFGSRNEIMPKNVYVLPNHIDMNTIGSLWGTSVRPNLRGQEVLSLICAYLRCHDVKVRNKLSVFYYIWQCFCFV